MQAIKPGLVVLYGIFAALTSVSVGGIEGLALFFCFAYAVPMLAVMGVFVWSWRNEWRVPKWFE